MKKEFIIGIDVSKDKLDACLLAVGSSEPKEEKVVRNQQVEITKYFMRHIKKLGAKNILVCLEHTGYYGLQLCVMLQQLELDYVVVPALEIKQSQGITRGKSDKVDARRIAVYAWRYQDKLKLTKLPTNELLLIKELIAVREQYIKMRVQLKNSVKQHEIIGQFVNNDFLMKSINEQLEALSVEIEKIDLQIVDVLKRDKELEQNYNLLKTIKGIGPVTAVVLMVTTNNFTSITDGRKYSSYAGVAPFTKESGKMNKGSRVSNLANKKVKALLHNGACTAINYDNELKIYYKRKVNEGKAKLSVLNAVACKIVNRAFAVVKRQTPYVNLYQNNFAKS
jgi:transposase